MANQIAFLLIDFSPLFVFSDGLVDLRLGCGTGSKGVVVALVQYARSRGNASETPLLILDSEAPSKSCPRDHTGKADYGQVSIRHLDFLDFSGFFEVKPNPIF